MNKWFMKVSVVLYIASMIWNKVVIMPINAVNPYLVDRLFPKGKSIKNINDMINNSMVTSPSVDMVINTLTLVQELKSVATAMLTGVAVEQGDSGLDYAKYITPGNPEVVRIVGQITNASDSDDDKMFSIEQWVQQNIEYKSDISNYGQLERWAYPIETLLKRSGDCEDQAFLIHSMGISAGVSPEKLRTYGGLVFDPNSPSAGGHGWTAYKRDSDGQFITLDTSYYPISTPLSDRPTMSEDIRYIDDFWYIQSGITVATPYANKVRLASILKGVNINVMA
jgi:hypothetical protein